MTDSRTYFDQHGPNWVRAAYQENLAPSRAAAALQLLKAFQPRSLLDVGCGTGSFLAAADFIQHTAGADFSTSMLATARRNLPDVRFSELNLNLPEEDAPQRIGVYQAITMLGVVHYLNNALASLKTVRRLTESEGILIITFRNRLYNLQAESNYRQSADTLRDERYLQHEASIWNSAQGENFGSQLPHAPLSLIDAEARFLGNDDKGWDPHNLDVWKQFTPFEAARLLQKAQFKPISCRALNLQPDTADVSAMSRATSFMITAQAVE